MATFVSGGSDAVTFGSTYLATFTPAVGNVLVAHYFGQNAPTGISDTAGHTWTPVAALTVADGVNGRYQSVWTATSTTSSAITITVTSAAGFLGTCIGSAWSGVDTTTPIESGTATPGDGNSNAPSAVSGNTAQTTALGYAVVGVLGGGDTPTPAAGNTEAYEKTPASFTYAGNLQYRTRASGTAITAAYSGNLTAPENWVAGAFIFTEGGGGGPTAPAQVTGLTATSDDGAVALSWTAPSNGGSAITDYLVEYKLTSSGTWLTFSDGTSTTTSATVTGLTNLSSYDFRVSAINAIGTGTASSTASATPAAVLYVAQGAKGSGTTTAALPYPAGPVAGHLAIAVRNVWNGTATATAESGWTSTADLSGGTGTAADSHTTRIHVDRREETGSESGSVTFDQAGSPSGAIGVMLTYRRGSSAIWDVASATGTDDTHGTARSVTASSTISLAPGDVLLAAVAVDTDSATAFTSPTLTASGITFSSVVERVSPTANGITTGTDGNVGLYEATVTAGTATVAPALSLSGGPSQCGPVAFVRLRSAGVPTLVVADSAQGQTTDAVTLTQAHVLTVADSAQAQVADIADSNPSTPFTEPFNDSAALLRFLQADWRTQWDNENVGLPGDGNDHNQGYGGSPPGNVTVSGGKMQVACGVQNYGETTMLSLTRWDGTGTLSFKVNGDDNSEAQIVALFTDRPYAFTSFDGENANGPKPETGFGLYAGCPKARMWNAYVQTDWHQNADVGTEDGGSPSICSGVVTKGTEQTWEVSLVSGRVLVTINGTQALPTFLPPAGLFTTGMWVRWGTHNHASDKYTDDSVVTNIFDDFAYSGMPAARAATVAPSGENSGTQWGWTLVSDASTPVVHSTSSLAKGTATAAWLVVNTGALGDTDWTTSSRLNYRLNGSTWHAVAPPGFTEHAFHNAQSFSIPLTLSELVDGVNTVEFTGTSIANITSARYGNIQIIATGGSGDAPAADLVVADSAQGQASDAATLTQLHVLTVADASTPQTADTFALTQLHLLTAADSAQGQTADAATLTQAQLLALADSSQGQTADAATLTQLHLLAVAESATGQTADPVSLTQQHALAVDDAAQGQATDAVVLAQLHILVVADTATSQTADATTLNQAQVLVVADSASGQTADPATLTQDHVLTAADSAQGQTADAVVLAQLHLLVVADSTQAQATDSVTLATLGVLAVDDSAQGQAADNIALTQLHLLVAADSAQGQTADAVTLGGTGVLAVADTATGQTTDPVTLTQQHVLAVADSVQSQTADGAVITQVHFLAVIDTAQGQIIDTVSLSAASALTVADTAQGQLAEATAISQVHVLAVLDSVQAQTSDSATLTQLHTLVVADTVQMQIADVVVWAAAVILGSMSGEWVRVGRAEWVSATTSGEWVSGDELAP